MQRQSDGNLHTYVPGTAIHMAIRRSYWPCIVHMQANSYVAIIATLAEHFYFNAMNTYVAIMDVYRHSLVDPIILLTL